MLVHFADAPTYCVAWLRTVSTVLNFTKWMAIKWTHTNTSKTALGQLQNSKHSYEIHWRLRNSYEVLKIQPLITLSINCITQPIDWITPQKLSFAKLRSNCTVQYLCLEKTIPNSHRQLINELAQFTTQIFCLKD